MSAAAGKTSYDETGAGGKFRGKPLRKSQATPYERPPTAIRNTSSGSGNGWLSKIIDPASRLINASAHRLFGLSFRKRLMPPPAARQDASELNRIIDSVPRSEIQVNVGDQSGTDNHAREHVSLDIDARNQGISEIEKILAQKTFTESEINRLTALLNSRTAEDNGKIESEERVPKSIFENGNLSEFKSPLVPDNSCNSRRYPGAISSLYSSSKVMGGEIATPAELAKVYMCSRPSKVSPFMLGSRIQATKNDLPLINSVAFPSQSPSMSSANKSLSRVSAPENGYLTPRLRGRSAIYNMARTPYSKSHKGSDNRVVNSCNFESIQFALEANKISKTKQTALKRRSNVLDDDISSAGPIRRIRQRPSLLSSIRLNEPAGGNSPNNGPAALSIYRSNSTQSKTPDEKFMSAPSQSSVVAQKILQQLEKLSPPPKEKSSENKSVVSPEKSAFTLTTDTLPGQAFRCLEKAESSKIIESSQEESKVNDSAQRLATNEEFTVLNCIKQLEKNGPQKPTSASKSNSESVLNSCDLAEKEQALQNNDPQTKTDKNGTVSNGSIKFGKEGEVSYSLGSPTMTIQPTAADNASFPFFGKVSSDEQTTIAQHFRNGAKVPDKFSPSTFTLSSPTAKSYQTLLTSSLSESRTSNLSGVSDTPKTNPGCSMSTQGAVAVDGSPSIASNAISNTSVFFSSNAFANNGFAAASQFNGAGAHNINSFTTTVSAASVPNATTGNKSSGISLFSTSIPPFSVSPVFGNSLRKDPQLSSNVNGPPSDVVTEKLITAVNNTDSNPFGSGGTSSATENGSHVISGLGSSMSSNADSTQAKTITTVVDTIPQSTIFKFGSSGSSSAPAFSLLGTTNSAPANSITSLPPPMFGQNSLPSSKEAGSVGSNGCSSNSLFGSNWQSNNSPLFGSTTGSSAVPQSVFQFGSSAPILSSSTPGSLFGSSNATFSFTSAATSGSTSLFAAPQPLAGTTTKTAFTFGSSASPPNSNDKNQTSMEDTMAEDTVQASAPSTSVFGQPQSNSNSVFTFGSPSPSVTPGTGVFQFGGTPSPASLPNQAPFQASGSFNGGGGGFSLGKGGDDKSQRKNIKVKRTPKRR